MTQRTPPDLHPDHRIAGRSSTARQDTGTDTDQLPPPLGQGRPAGDMGGRQALPGSETLAEAGGHPAESDISSDTGAVRDELRRAAKPGADARDAEPHNEKPGEQVGRPGRR